jgi:energy-coupling factor transport system permease protein
VIPGLIFCGNMLNPAVKIISLMVFAVMLQRMQMQSLIICTGVFLAAVAMIRASDFLLLLRRARWLLLSITLIYAYATPGEFVRQLPDVLAPTYEGLRDGAIQAVRLAIMLAALSLLLATTSRAQIMAGIYQLLKPLQFFGVLPERFSARLWLTLHYVEHMPSGTLKKLRQESWSMAALDTMNDGPERIVLEFLPWRWLDYLAIAVLPLLWWTIQ